MPVINVEISSLTLEQKRELAEKLTAVAAEVTGKRKEAFYVFINEYDKDNIAVGGQLLSDR